MDNEVREGNRRGGIVIVTMSRMRLISTEEKRGNGSNWNQDEDWNERVKEMQSQ